MTDQDKKLIQQAENVHMREYNMPEILDSLLLQAHSQEARNEIQRIKSEKLQDLDRYNYHREEDRAGIL